MYVKRNYSLWMTFNWSKKPFILGFIYAAALSAGAYYLDIHFTIPWQPLSILGIAVAFYLGFKNNSAYDRTWEGRKIWGSIVNNSRTLGAALSSFVKGDKEKEVRKEIIYRHIAWLTALRYQLRLSKPWEHTEDRLKGSYSPTICEEYMHKLESDLATYLKKDEIEALKSKTNTATQIMHTQSVRLQELKDQGYFEDFRHMEFHHLITSFYEDQGKAERIKTFPFPRQYASTAVWLNLVFCALLPFGLMSVFDGQSHQILWLCPLLSALIIWVFTLMEKIGDYSENPFEGTYNDVPITSISRTIEIDLREMINDSDIPEPIKETNGFLM
ncbi:MAG: putative membrane protein [Lentimonas sp.]|jgi:putative membrane protein